MECAILHPRACVFQTHTFFIILYEFSMAKMYKPMTGSKFSILLHNEIIFVVSFETFLSSM